MLNRRFSPIAGLALALVVAFFLAACEEDSSGSSTSDTEEQAGLDAADAVGAALDNALDQEDQNPNSLRIGGQATFGDLARITRDLPGLGPHSPSALGINQVQDTGGGSVTWDASYSCTGGGTVGVTGAATATWDYRYPEEPVYWHETFTLTDVNLALTNCSEEGYTLNGTAVFDATDTFNLDQSAAGSTVFNLALDINESATADITALQIATGSTFDFTMAWSLVGTLNAQADILTGGEPTITSVNITGTYTVNGTTCTGTWTDPAQPEPTISCE